MGIYLPNMEMPRNCGECFACKAELSQEKKVIYVCCFTRKEYVSDENRVETYCPLVPVPPHGRLIDADALIAAHEQVCSRSMKFNLDLAPTIIPAEQAEEGEL